MEGSSENIIEEVRESLMAIVGEQNSRLTEVTRRQDGMMSSMSDEFVELRKIVRELQGYEGGWRPDRPMKLDLTRFTGKILKGGFTRRRHIFATIALRTKLDCR